MVKSRPQPSEKFDEVPLQVFLFILDLPTIYQRQPWQRKSPREAEKEEDPV